MDSPAVITRDQARELDHRAIHEFGIPSIVLMENAARACADEAERMLRAHGVQRAMDKLRAPGSKDDIPRNVDELERWKASLSFSEHASIILCGPGNNGGDGLAVARTLHNRGHRVSVLLAGPDGCLERASADVRTNAALLARIGVAIRPITTGPEAVAAAPQIRGAPLIVDAMFGTGLTRAVDDPWRALIQIANESQGMRLAVDMPSGLDANTGDVLGTCLRADVTVTFTALKPGLLTRAGPTARGRVSVAEIGIPSQWLQQLL